MLVSPETTVRFLQQTGWSRLKTLFPLGEGVRSVCMMIIFRGIRSRGMILALERLTQCRPPHTGVCVCFFFLCERESGHFGESAWSVGAKAGKKTQRKRVMKRRQVECWGQRRGCAEGPRKERSWSTTDEEISTASEYFYDPQCSPFLLVNIFQLVWNNKKGLKSLPSLFISLFIHKVKIL